MGYEIINLGRGEPVLMTDFVEIIESLVGRPAIVSAVPAPASEPKINFADVSKARRLLGYDPRTSVTDGLADMWRWYQQEVLASPGA
jgi:UDP-glucuronate 4-epimerase